MIPAAGLEVPDTGAFGKLNAPGSRLDRANARDGNAINFAWQFREILGVHREQQLEILAAMKRQQQWIEGAPPADLGQERIDGDAGCVQQGADLALFAEVIEV